MEGWWWKALWNEAPYSYELNSAFSGIQTRDLVILSEVLTSRASGRFYIIQYNRYMHFSNHVHITEKGS